MLLEHELVSTVGAFNVHTGSVDCKYIASFTRICSSITDIEFTTTSRALDKTQENTTSTNPVSIQAQ